MPKTPKRERFNLRLDRYHHFVLDRLAEAMEASKPAVLERMVVQWVTDHDPQVRQAGASLDRWLEVREKWEPSGPSDDED